MPDETNNFGKFTPPTGKTILILGQDTDSTDEYVESMGIVPAGVTNYTSISKLEGLHETADYGSGPHNLDYLAQTYPHSVIAVGLSMEDYFPQVVDGSADSRIDRLLDALAAYDRPVFVRFGYESDGSWNHYDPDMFVKAWRHFHERIQAKAVTNIALVWQSATWCDDTYKGYPIEAWYPGDETVDWIGLSYFIQAADCDGRPFDELLAFAREHSKPVMIAEATPQRYKTGEMNFSIGGSIFTPKTADEIWDEWYVPLFKYIQQNSDVIRALAYINADWDHQPMWSKSYRSGYWGDRRVQVTTRSKRAGWQRSSVICG